MYVKWVTSSCQNLFLWLSEKIIYSKMDFFDKNTFGRIINRFTQDTACVHDDLGW